MSKEKVIAKGGCGGEVRIIRYSDDGQTHYDLQTDGRILLTPACAKAIAEKLLKFAELAASN